MKYGAMALLVMALPGYAIAEEAKGWRELCSETGDLARKIMTARQGGFSMDSMFALVGDSEMGQDIVISAYETPRYSTAKMQDRAVSEFANQTQLQCIKSIRG